MKSFFAPLAVVALVASTVSAQFTINSISNVVVCRPTLITWTGGVPPYFLSILPAGQPSAPALVDLGQQQGNSVTWLTNLGVGTSAFLNLRDNTGALAQSASFTVLAGTNTTCVTQTLSQSQGTAVATPASASATNAPASATAASSGASGVAITASGSKTSSTAKPTTSSAAISKYAGAGAVAVIGSAFIALAI